MRITIDTDKGIIIVPNTFEANLEKQNNILKRAGVETVITPKSFIENAVAEALTRPVMTQEQAKDWNPALEKQIVK